MALTDRPRHGFPLQTQGGNHYPYFIDKETGLGRLSHLPKVTQLVSENFNGSLTDLEFKSFTVGLPATWMAPAHGSGRYG